jgi:hypothetical protein
MRSKLMNLKAFQNVVVREIFFFSQVCFYLVTMADGGHLFV